MPGNIRVLAWGCMSIWAKRFFARENGCRSMAWYLCKIRPPSAMKYPDSWTCSITLWATVLVISIPTSTSICGTCPHHSHRSGSASRDSAPTLLGGDWLSWQLLWPNRRRCSLAQRDQRRWTDSHSRNVTSGLHGAGMPSSRALRP